MAPTPDVRPVGDLPHGIGKTAARELAHHGVTSLALVAAHAQEELLAIHGVGPKAIAILGDALTAKGLRFQAPLRARSRSATDAARPHAYTSERAVPAKPSAFGLRHPQASPARRPSPS